MKYLLLSTLTLGLLGAQTMKYPQTKKGPVVDDYHGAKIADPYRWLEDTDSADTAAWVEAENRVTQDYLAKIPARARLKDRLTALYNYERYSLFQKSGSHYLFLRNDGLQNQDVLYVTDSLTGKERVLLDPNTLRADGTAAVSSQIPSPNGKLVAYGLADAGSDWTIWRVRDVQTGKDLEDEIHWSKFSEVSWTPDSRGLYYQRFAEPKAGEALRAQNVFAKLYLHRLGEPQSEDRLLHERPDHPQYMFQPEVTDDGRYLVIVVEVTDFGKNLVAYQDLDNQTPKTVELIKDLDAAYLPLGSRDSVLYFQTTYLAPKGRIIAIDLAHPERANWREVVPAQNEAIDAATMLGDRLVVSYLKDAASQMKVYGVDGRLTQEVKLPSAGTVRFFNARQSDPELFFAFGTYTAPPAIYRLDARTLALSVVRKSKLSFDPAQFETRQVFYNSKDGTRIPMSLVSRKGVKQDGTNPTLLYGYGGFNIPMLPQFSPWTVAWMEMGGVYAVANLRGGSEYGEEWHLAAKKAKKQNVFDDFIAAGEWLIAYHYTTSRKLAILGGSNGGLLVGAVVNQRPDLFGAAIAAVGVMDMLRFQKFTIGAAWVDEYGSSDNVDDFRVLRAYSPLHNIKPGGKYPAVLVTTSDHDDRVVPGHSFKYAATLQAAQGGASPILIRIETRAGHGAGKPVTKIIDENADRLAFLTRELALADSRP